MAYFDMNPLLAKMLDSAEGVSDLNLSVGKPPQVEIEGKLQAVPYVGVEKLAAYQTELIAMRLLRGKRDLIEKLLRTGSVDLSYSLAHKTRFRVNIFSQRGSYSVVFRVIPNKIPTVEELGIPTQLNEITEERNGIVLVTGPTGSGKSTTLAALLNKMNYEKAIHIITIEDPVVSQFEKFKLRHYRRSHRVSLPGDERHYQPARSRRRHRDVFTRSPRRPSASAQGDSRG